MMLRSHDSWTGFLHLTPIINVAILFFSIITFSLAVAYTKQLYDAPIDHDKWNYPEGNHRWSTSWFIFYGGFFPLIGLIHAALDLALFLVASINPIYALTASLAFCIGWIVQVSFWFDCDYRWEYDICYQFYVLAYPDPSSEGSLTGVSDGLTAAKISMAMVMLILYVVYMSFAAVAVHRARMAKRAQRKGVENHKLELLRQ